MPMARLPRAPRSIAARRSASSSLEGGTDANPLRARHPVPAVAPAPGAHVGLPAPEPHTAPGAIRMGDAWP